MLWAAACGGSKAPEAVPHASAAARAWQLADVAMLMPFPGAAEVDRLLAPSSSGEQGPLVPAAWLAQIPKPLAINQDPALALAQLRVVSIRIDPCALHPGSDKCHPVVRLSWQPFLVENGAVHAIDASIHTNYALPPEQFAKLADELWQLKLASGIDTGGPLGVHPILAKQGLAGPYWTELEKTLLRYCGEKTLVKLTTMQLGGRTNVWIFSGLEQDAHGAPSPLVIPKIGTQVQTIAVHAQPPFEFDGGLFSDDMAEDKRLEPENQAELNRFLRGTMELDHAIFAKVIESTNFLELPSAESTVETVDCASCHIAQAARVWIDKHAPALHAAAPLPKLEGFDLANPTKLALTNQLRAFGYFEKYAVISQRTINESALTALRMRSNQ